MSEGGTILIVKEGSISAKNIDMQIGSIIGIKGWHANCHFKCILHTDHIKYIYICTSLDYFFTGNSWIICLKMHLSAVWTYIYLCTKQLFYRINISVKINCVKIGYISVTFGGMCQFAVENNNRHW